MLLFSQLFLFFIIIMMLSQYIEVDGQEKVLNLLNKDIGIINPHGPPVFVQGKNGEPGALQFDGYSTWVKNSIIFPPLNLEEFTFQTTFAIPIFPSEKAIIFSTPAFEIQIGKHGMLSVIFRTKQSSMEFIRIDVEQETLPIYEWITLSFVVNKNNLVQIFLNDKLVKIGEIERDQIQWPSSDNKTEYFVGRRPENENDMFDLNAFNGIISEMSLIYNRTEKNQEKDLAEGNQLTLSTTVKNNIQKEVSTNFDLPYDNPYDLHRPRLHAMPQRGWTNEPHGFVYHNGEYHIFFQKNGNGPYFYKQSWGHLISKDLVHWTEQPVILQSQPGLDSMGIWSGHLVFGDEPLFQNVPTIFYTGVDGAKAGIFVATGSPDLRSWSKFGVTQEGAKPVISNRPLNKLPGDDFRDPFLFKFNQTWHMIIGTGIDTDMGRMGALFLYTSKDLYTFEWKFQGTMFTGNMSSMNFEVGQFWEMPVFLQTNSKDWLLVVNKTPNQNDVARTFYWTGNYNGSKFIPYDLTPKELEIFVNELSPTVAYDEAGRLTAIGIAPDTQNAFLEDTIYHARVGWANVFSFPKVWNISEDGRIVRTPHPALKILRKEQLVSKASTKVDMENLLLVQGERQLEIKTRFTCSDNSTYSTVGFVLFKSSTEQTKIYYNFVEEKMVVDKSLSSTNQNAVRRIDFQEYTTTNTNQIDFHIFIDHSMIEVFIDDKDAFVVRTFPQNIDSTQMELEVQGDCVVANVQVWKLDL